jgi:hypothetical protein
MGKHDDKLDLKATIEVESDVELYKVVDFLNKNLKEKNVIFGLAKKNGKMVISIYET